MINPDRLTRRDVLKMSGLGVAALGLAACESTAQQGIEAPPNVPLMPPDGVDDDAWADVRTHFLIDSGLAYLNNASLGMPPASVVGAVSRGYRLLSEDPLDGKNTLQAVVADQVEPGLARVFGAHPGEITLTRNASEALHLQSVGLRLRPGDEVLITTQEHPAGRRPWLFRQARHGVRVTEVFVPSPLPPPGEVVSRMRDAVTDRTRAIAFCHVTRGGHVYPVKELCAMAAERDLVSLVDGAQAVGQLPVDLSNLGCDAYSASLHKWMLAPAGTGFLYVRTEARDRIVSSFAHDATVDAPAFGTPGTADFPVRAAVAAALDFVETLGLDRIEARCRYLSDYLKQSLEGISEVTQLSGAREQSAPGSTIFEKAGLDPIAAVPLILGLADAHIDEHQRDGLDAIRISTHVYNTTAEIDRVVEALASVPQG